MLRNDFVSNSSSSSFILKTSKDMLDKNTFKKFLTFFTHNEKLDDYNVEQYTNRIEDNLVWSIFEFHFMTQLNKDDLYDKYYIIPPMECLDIRYENFDEILANIFKDEDGGFESSDMMFFEHEDFVFSHRGIARITKKSVEYTRKILKMIRDNEWSLKLLDPKYCVIENHLIKEKYIKDGEERERNVVYKTIEEAEEFLNKLDKELENNNYIVIAMSYSGNSYEDGKLWYDRDWRDGEKSCYELIKENNFGETIYIDW